MSIPNRSLQLSDFRISPLEGMPERFQRIADAVHEQDVRWFEQHPKEDSYVRHYVPGEAADIKLSQNELLVVVYFPEKRATVITPLSRIVDTFTIVDGRMIAINLAVNIVANIPVTKAVRDELCHGAE